MKKAYVKPEIIFENFSLSTNIAGDCEKIIDTQARNQCGIPTSSGETIFTQDACDMWKEGVDTYDGFCYHIPEPEANLFNS